MPYKIVRYTRISGEYRSLIEESTATVIYAVGMKTKPNLKCGPLTAFKTMKDLINFVGCHGWEGYPIFEVELVKYKGEKKALWNLETFDGLKREFRELPAGTILCSSITLIKKVWL